MINEFEENSQYAVEVRGLSKSFGDFRLGELDWRVPAGSIMGLVGENGAGKTTLLKLLMNVLLRDSGEVSVLDRDNQSAGFVRLKEEIGVVINEAGLPGYLNAGELDRIMRQTFTAWDGAYYRQMLHDFGLPSKKLIKDFSCGMKMKLCIALAMSHHPRLLILDEPTSGLDPMVRDSILNILNDFTRDPQNSIIISSHIVSDLEKICDYITFLHKGELMFCEEKDRLLEDYAILKLSAADFADIPPEAVISKRIESYGVEALVRKDRINPAIAIEHSTLEDIIIFWAKGGAR